MEQGLTPGRLREINRHQVGLLKRSFEALDIDPATARIEPMADECRGGFLAIRAPRAGDICALLRARGVLTDFRNDVLRVGPAPYLSDDQLRQAIDAMAEVFGVAPIKRSP
jgi:kynureninase